MISASLLRAIQCTEKRPRCPGRALLRLQPAPCNEARIRTGPCSRRGLLEQSQVGTRPRGVLGAAPKGIWTQGAQPARAPEDRSKQVSVRERQREAAALSASQRVKEAGRDFTYLIIVLIGMSVTGGLFYVVFKELFSSSSPNKIFGRALEKCRSHPEVVSVFGESIKGYGESTRQGRRQHVRHIEYVKDGLTYIRLKFYIEGSVPGKQGTVHLEVKENPESGRYEFRYIFVDVDAFPRRTIVIEDNRS
ncbi:mitochondrial import inner membrane translocase subunit Tim21-like [Petaurus breviceps papuanus]|uniref:mitochondrial import inner membrane translocase subunit Tim21-like n=1 Tax=Petaurus breviceps papuanus TaxID=3040969 RepID=UPI0036D94F58